MVRSGLSSVFRKWGIKIVSGFGLILFLAVAVGYSSPRYFSAHAASWLDQIFGNHIPRSRSRGRRVQPQGYFATQKRGRQAYAIGRIDTVRSRASRKKRRTYRIPKNSIRKYTSSRRGYRTMCVRTCDGYYFPISFSTSKHNLKKDAQTCSSRCGAPAKLYYYPNPGGEITDMISYKGNRKYSKLKYAFLFKKKFVSSCRCRPEPWTKAAKLLHKQYALAETRATRLEKLARVTGKKVRKRKYSKRRSRNRRKGRKYSRASRRYGSRALRSIGSKKRVRRRSGKRRYLIRKARNVNSWTY